MCPRYLLIRGAWLIFLELTFLRVAWTFNFDFQHYEMAGVIWVIGCCMILMAGLVKLPLPVVGAIGVIIIAAHNLMDSHMGKLLDGLDQNPLSGLWKIFYVGFFAGPVQFGPNGPEPDRALFHHSVDRRHGGGLRLRQNPDLGARAQKTSVPGDWTLGHRTVPGAPRIQPVRRSAPLACRRRGTKRHARPCRRCFRF